MERLKLSLPGTFSFSTITKVRITDLNYGGHVGNDVFLSLVHEARQQFLYFHNYSEMNFAGIGLIMADAAIEYKRELKYPGEVKISVACTGFDKLGFDLFYLIEVKEGEKWMTAGKVKTGMICFNYTIQKPVPVPQEAIDKLQPQIKDQKE